MEIQTIDLNKIVIKPITNEQDFEDANAIINMLIDANLIEDIQQRKKALPNARPN